jgi:hypothetical protein
MKEDSTNPSQRAHQGTDYGEHEEVQEVHAAIQREKGEPRVGLEPLSMWLIVVYGLAVFFGGAYLGRFSGTFSGDSLDPYPAPPQASKPGGGGQGGGQVAELSPTRLLAKIFSASASDLSSSQWLLVRWVNIRRLAEAQGHRRVRRPATIVLEQKGPVTVKGQKYGTAVGTAWDKTLNEKRDRRRPDLRAELRWSWCQPCWPEQTRFSAQRGWPIILAHS